MFYIQENDKLSIIDKLLCKIKIEGNKIILPTEGKNLTEKKQKQLAKKTLKILKQSSSKKMLISKIIAENKKYVSILEQENYINITGKWLYKMLIPEILEYILKKENLKQEETNIYILVNDLTDIVIENIRHFALKYKSITIITNHIEKFKKIEEQIYEEQGIYLTVINNKKKSLSKAKIIINFDFPKELINQYNIYEKAIIINIPGKLKINKKRFDGKIIQNYEIKNKSLNCEENLKYENKAIYESKFYYEQPYKYIRDKIEKDKIKIEKLYLQNDTY